MYDTGIVRRAGTAWARSPRSSRRSSCLPWCVPPPAAAPATCSSRCTLRAASHGGTLVNEQVAFAATAQHESVARFMPGSGGGGWTRPAQITAASVIICCSQLKNMLGYHVPRGTVPRQLYHARAPGPGPRRRLGGVGGVVRTRGTAGGTLAHLGACSPRPAPALPPHFASVTIDRRCATWAASTAFPSRCAAAAPPRPIVRVFEFAITKH